MRYKINRLACLLLAGILLAGCGTTGDSSLSGPASSVSSASVANTSSMLPASEPEIDPTQFEEYRNAEPWQLAFYEVVSSSVVASWQLYIPQNGTPVLTRTSNHHADIWRYENSKAAMVWEGTAASVLYRTDNGNPIIYDYQQQGVSGDSVSTYIELDGEAEVPLCEYGGPTHVYLNKENRQLRWCGHELSL